MQLEEVAKQRLHISDPVLPCDSSTADTHTHRASVSESLSSERHSLRRVSPNAY